MLQLSLLNQSWMCITGSFGQTCTLMYLSKICIMLGRSLHNIIKQCAIVHVVSKNITMGCPQLVQETWIKFKFPRIGASHGYIIRAPINECKMLNNVIWFCKKLLHILLVRLNIGLVSKFKNLDLVIVNHLYLELSPYICCTLNYCSCYYITILKGVRSCGPREYKHGMPQLVACLYSIAQRLNHDCQVYGS